MSNEPIQLPPAPPVAPLGKTVFTSKPPPRSVPVPLTRPQLLADRRPTLTQKGPK